jgi:hypothetical protein
LADSFRQTLDESLFNRNIISSKLSLSHFIHPVSASDNFGIWRAGGRMQHEPHGCLRQHDVTKIFVELGSSPTKKDPLGWFGEDLRALYRGISTFSRCKISILLCRNLSIASSRLHIYHNHPCSLTPSPP